MAVVRTLGIGIIAAGLLVVGGCKDKGAGASGNTPAGSTARATPPGKPVGNQSQILGRWARDDDGDIMGIEFGQDGKAIVNLSRFGTTDAMTFDYALLEGGRVRLTSINMYTQVFTCSVKEPNMTFEPESEDMTLDIKHSSKFVRIKPGESLASIVKARTQEADKRQQALGAALGQYVGQAGLSLVTADPNLRLDRMALELTGGPPTWTGTAYVEGNTVVARQVQVGLQSPAGPGQPSSVIVTFGNVVGPPGMRQMPPESMTLTVAGTPDKPEVTGNGRALRPDKTTFDELKGRYTKAATEREAALNKFADQFGTYCRLEGKLTWPGNPGAAPTGMTIALLRAEGKPAFLWTDLHNNPNPAPAAFNQPAVVMLDGDTPVLNLGPSVGIVKAVTENGKPSITGTIRQMNAVFQIAESLTKDEILKQRAAVADFLNNQLSHGVIIRGPFTEDDRPDAPIRAVQLSLTGDAQHPLSGTFLPLWLGGKCEVTGNATETLMGATLDIDASKVVEDFSTVMRGHGPSMTLNVQWAGAQPVVTGAMKGGSNGNHLDLVVVSDEVLKKERARLDKILSAGAVFTLKADDRNNPGRPVSIELRTESAGGGLSGKATYRRKYEPTVSPLTGEVQEKDGYIVVELLEAASTPAGLPTGKIHLWSIFRDKGILLAGFCDQDGINPRRPEAMSFWIDEK